MNLEFNYWKKNMEIYLNLPYSRDVKYYSWQPARWASNQAAVSNILKVIDQIETVCELGAGSAAFSLEMYNQNQNLKLTAIDVCEMACKFGKTVANDMNIPINYINKNFFRLNKNVKYDFVLSLGVIEHFNKKKMNEFIKLCKMISNKYILIAIPNQNSIIFKSYVEWCKKNGNNYEEKHENLDIKMLLTMIKNNGLEPIIIDGFQMFLSEGAFLQENYKNNKEYINILKESLIKEKKSFTKLYPNYNFKLEDIPYMKRAELSFSKEKRLNMAFMVYVLAKKISD